jgi:exodeoxyribonuclease V alpha subunit
MDTLSGYIEKIIYRNAENGYTVLEISADGESRTLIGSLADVSEGEYIEASGRLVDHPLYGVQLSVESYERKAPEDKASILKYLSSGAIKGIGEALAARIVKKFGKDTMRILEEEPERLAEVKGISERMAMNIGSQAAEKRDQRDAMLFLQQYGISLNLAVKIFEKYGNAMYRIIRENPYKLADDMTGVGFKMADEIAAKAGIHTDSDFRIRSGMLYTLQQALANGHTCLPMEELTADASRLLGVPEESVERHITDMILDKKLIVKKKDETSMVFASHYYYMELNVARMLHDLNGEYDISDTEIESRLARIEKMREIRLADRQREAVFQAVKNGLFIMTGGPGTGKTTTITSIIDFFEAEEAEIRLAAPTGRAAKRMTEATGREACTIHRLLELTGMQGDSAEKAMFMRDEQNPLDADVIIIDEMSMVDIYLMQALLKAVPVGCRLILVGDVDQLPSVGPGNVLRDILDSGCFHVVKLTKIFRQADTSDIVVNAHKINEGQHIDPSAPSRDFLFIRRGDANAAINAAITLVKEKLPAYVQAKPYEIQVMTPMRKGMLGVERLNAIFQEFLNPPSKEKAEKDFGRCIFREGDKVMQIRNNYQMEWEVRSRYGIAEEKGTGIFNGDMGILREVNLFAEELTVEFDERRLAVYSFKEAEELELAYAITIHKSQGSEYPAAVIPLLSGPPLLMTRNLLYTAITRAKSCVCIVGSVDTFQGMIDNMVEQRRLSGLADRIRELRIPPEDSL